MGFTAKGFLGTFQRQQVRPTWEFWPTHSNGKNWALLAWAFSAVLKKLWQGNPPKFDVLQTEYTIDNLPQVKMTQYVTLIHSIDGRIKFLLWSLYCVTYQH